MCIRDSIYPFGSTEEPLRYATLGTRQRGHEGGPPFDAATGRGYVARHAGQYHDALRKNNQVIVAVVESFGHTSARRAPPAYPVRLMAPRCQMRSGNARQRIIQFGNKSVILNRLFKLFQTRLVAGACEGFEK